MLRLLGAWLPSRCQKGDPALVGTRLNTLDQIDAAEVAALDDLFEAAPPEVAAKNGLHRLRRDGALVLTCETFAVLGFNRAFGISETQTNWENRLETLLSGEVLLGHGTIPICIRAGDRQVAAMLGRNGYIETAKGDARWIWTDRVQAAFRNACYPIRELAREHSAEFDAIFRVTRDMPVSLSGWAARLVGRNSWRCFAAFDGDRVIATGAVFIGGDYAWLGFGSTLAAYRGQGLQAALIRIRIDTARAAGVSLLTGGTGISSSRSNDPSFVNFRRAGFALAYEQRAFRRVVRSQS